MKLVFPGGEHPQVLLGPGVNRVGSDPQATIVLDHPGVRPQHCQLHVTPNGVMLDVPHGTTVSVNGPWAFMRLLDAGSVSRAGDDIRARFVIGGRDVTYTIQVGSVSNPFFLRALSEFNCPSGV